MSAEAYGGATRHAHAAHRVASGFHWADITDALFGKSGSLYEKATFDSSTAGINNRAFGQVLWQQANVSTPLWGMMPKVPSDDPVNSISDPRPQSYRVAFNPPAHTAGSEGSSWSTPVTFDTREVNADPHQGEILWEATLLQQLQSEIQDGVPFENLTQIGDEYFQLSLEQNGLAVDNESATNGAGTTYSNLNDIAMLDKVVSSADEEANADDASGNAYADGDCDVYDIDRSATGGGGSNESNWADAVVDHNSAGGDRQLTEDLINGVIESLEQNNPDWRQTGVIFTGTTTARVMSELKESTFRADALAEAIAQNIGRGTDEAETRLGHAYNAQISHWDGIPVVQGQNVVSDTLDRIYFLDMSSMTDPVTGESVPKLGIEVYLPMQVETAGLGQATNTLAIDKKADQVGALQYHELLCRRFNHQGKLRDLKE